MGTRVSAILKSSFTINTERPERERRGEGERGREREEGEKSVHGRVGSGETEVIRGAVVSRASPKTSRGTMQPSTASYNHPRRHICLGVTAFPPEGAGKGHVSPYIRMRRRTHNLLNQSGPWLASPPSWIGLRSNCYQPLPPNDTTH